MIEKYYYDIPKIGDYKDKLNKIQKYWKDNVKK